MSLDSVPKLGTVLVVDDEPINIRVIADALKSDYTVIAANSALSALQRLERGAAPDLILTDIEMPELNGIELCRALKSDAKYSEYSNIPVIFITSHSDISYEASAFAAGGVDFVSKPISPARLLMRVRLHLQLETNRRKIARQNELLEKEQNDIVRILDKMRLRYPLESERLAYRMSPVDKTSGDVLFAAENAGGEYFFLGDFTGHGLPAAVGSPSLSRLFNELVVKQELSGDALLKDLNAELYALLPTGMFVCGCLVELEKGSGLLNIWNAALPAQLLWGDDVLEVASTYPPLGILSSHNYQKPSLTIQASKYQGVLLFTDGLTESVNSDDEMFGEDRVRQLIKQGRVSPQSLYEALHQYCAPLQPSDDLTLATIELI